MTHHIKSLMSYNEVSSSEYCSVDNFFLPGINTGNKIYSHGLALNCNTDMLWFSRIVPCGIRGKGVTSMTLQTGKEITVEDVVPTFLEEMKSIFEWDIEPIQEISVDPDSHDNDLFSIVTTNTH